MQRSTLVSSCVVFTRNGRRGFSVMPSSHRTLMRFTTRVCIGLLALAVALTVVSTAGLAAGDGPAGEVAGDKDVETLGDIDLVLEDEHVQIDDVEASGEGLPSMDIDERTIEIESATVETDGVTATFRGTTYEIGQVSIGLENVGVSLENVTIHDE
ncbi:hypothetical protein [Natronoglomus mannanivorans]|uniref:Uncharacterized protein n=1 Tax=Natronoglomus mannanivorans TaxID=2979990 RepID=A0AAP3E3T2_9EURY|nr:hypothetical protein [Halobacteria archaeon AArc-xg1-1]